MEAGQRAGLISRSLPVKPFRSKPVSSRTAKVRRRYPLHAVFIIYCLVSLLVAVGAFNSNNNLLFWLFGLSLGMLLVSGVISGTMMMAITVRREPIEQPRVGAPLRIRYTVTNRSRWTPVIGLLITERASPASGSGEQSATLNAAPSGAVPYIPARSTVTVETLALPTSRGRYALEGFEVLTTFPFGIIRKSLWHDDPVSIIVHPADAVVPGGLLDHTRGSTGSGAAATRPGRLGDEPVGVREYRPGDPPKLVSWRASARRPAGDLLVRQNAEGSPRRLWVLLRLSAASTRAQTEAALAAAASVIRAAAGPVGGSRLRIGLSLRTDWTDARGQPVNYDAPPRLGGASVVLLNDLALLSVPEGSIGNATVGGDPRLASSDIVVRVLPNGTIESPSTGAAVRRIASQPRSAVGEGAK